MEWFALIIPIILPGLALYFFKHKMTFWEVLLPIVIGCGVIAGMKGIMSNSLTNDIEYLSEYPVKAIYYEAWNERVPCTHSYDCFCSTDEDGYECCCMTCYDHTYDVDYHSESWSIKTNTGRYRGISKQYYHYLTTLWDNENFKDLKRDYHSIDGDSYETYWDNQFNTIEPRTFSLSYSNKPQAARTVFKFRDLDSIELSKVYNYPKLRDKGRQVNCLNCTKEENLYLERYNALIGVKKEIKIFIIKFKNEPYSDSELQKVYWKGGNKNELVICVGNDWTNTFSWCDDKLIQVETNELFNNDSLNMLTKIQKLEPLVQKHWTRKNFNDFNYIKIQLTNSQIFWIYFVVTLLSLGILSWGIFNEFEQE